MTSVLIIANSARMLAQAARNSGIMPYVIDCYGDQDTRQLAAHFIQVKSLTIIDLIPALETLKPYQLTRLVYGSGFESYSDSLFFLAQEFEISGNSPATFSRLQNKQDFFQTLKQLNIHYPEVSFTIPSDSKSWLMKPNQSLGGLNIRWAEKLAHPTHCYYQHYIQGKSLSVLFLANGEQAKIIGYNQQLTTSFKTQPFVFSGLINHAELSLTQQQILTHWINQLSEVYGLCGLNSLDFILADDVCYVLEINPRPPASMQLYDKNLFAAHLNNSLELPDFNNLQSLNRKYQAYQILYAQQQTEIKQQIQWLEGCVDLPLIGAIIDTEQPICSIIATGKNRVQLQRNLDFKKSFIFQQLSQ